MAKGEAAEAAAIEATKAARDKALDERIAGVQKAAAATFEAKENIMKLTVRLNAAAAKQAFAAKAAEAENTKTAAHRAEVGKQLAALKAQFEAMQKTA